MLPIATVAICPPFPSDNKHCDEHISFSSPFHKHVYKIYYTIIHLLYLLTHSTAPLSRCAGGWGRGEENECRKGQGSNRKGMFNKITNERAMTNELTVKHATKFLTMVLFYGKLIKQLSLRTRKDS